MNNLLSRRSFFSASTAAAGEALTTRASHAKARPTSPTCELIKVGAVAVGPASGSHLNFQIWAPMINPTIPEAWPVGRTTRMKITHCWDQDPEEAKQFAQLYGCETVPHYYDMVDKVDAMIFAGFSECKWWPQLTKPYLEAGLPCLINRPFAYSMRDAKEIVNRARENNAPILCTDEREYIKEAIVGHWKIGELLKEGRNIVAINSTNSSAHEYPGHGVHGLYFLLAVLGLDVEQVSLQSNGWWNSVTKTSHTPMTWGLLSLQYNGITRDDAPDQTAPFIACQHLAGNNNANVTMRIHYHGGWFNLDNHWTFGEHMDRLYYLFFPTILAFQRMVETRQMQWSYEYILKKTQIFLAGFKSHLDHDGRMVRVDDVPDDWEAPSVWPDFLDESIFR